MRGAQALAPKYYSEYAFGMERVTAARERLARLELRGLLDELDAKHGAAPAAIRAEFARNARRIFRAR